MENMRHTDPRDAPQIKDTTSIREMQLSRLLDCQIAFVIQ